MPNLQSELAARVFFVTQKEIWKINVQKDGERKSFYSKLPGKRGQKDCAAKAAAWLLSDSPLSLSDKTTVDDLFELYLKDKALETTDTYNIANRYKNHIAPVIGRIRISRLTKQDLKRVISTAYHEHHLSKKTLLNLRGDLSGFCGYLDDSDIRSDLRTNNIKIPASAPSSDKKSLDLISLYILFTHSQVLYNGAVCEDSLIYAYRFNVLTGLRTGEMMGLEWGDIDDDYIHVRRAINAKGVMTNGKNGYKQRKELLSQIEARLALISRQGRAFGIHLLLATQRPDANILSGQVKNNMNIRICGRADTTLSTIIIGDGRAAEQIPQDAQGRFLMEDGTIFQGYYFDGETVLK